MRRLDELLTHATARGTRMGPERLIDHLERRLRGETEVVVAAPQRGTTMLDTKERPTTPTEPAPRRRTRWAYALAAFALVAGSVALAVTLLGDGGEEDVAEITQDRAIELTQQFAANVRAGDMDALVAGSTGYLGKYAVRAFKERGYTVRALTRSAERLGLPGPFTAPPVRAPKTRRFFR